MSGFGKDELVLAARSGNLGEFTNNAFRALEGDDWKLLVDQAAAAYADNQLNLMNAVERLTKLDYATRDFLQALLPKLPLELTQLLAVFGTLEQISGSNGVDWWHAQAFEGWCVADPDRPEEALRAIENGTAPSELLQPALFAALKVDPQRYLSALLSRLMGQDEEIRTMAAWVLGRSSNLSGKERDLAFAELQQSYVSADGSIHAGSLAAQISIAIQDDRLEPLAVTAIERALTAPESSKVRAEAARELLQTRGTVGAHLIKAVFKLLAGTKADEPETIGTIDLVIYNGLKGSHAQLVAELLDQLISKQGIPLQRFDSTCNAILTGDRSQLEDILVRWLADGSEPMIRAVHDLIATSHGDPLRFNLDFSAADWSAEQAIVVTRKLTVSLFIYPVTLASLLLSLITTGPKAAVPALKQLVYDPLLVNFRISPREYLEKAAATAKPDVAAIITELLQVHQKYLDAIDAADPIPEMWPPDRHRYLVALQDAEEQRAISRAAESQSIFASLVSKSIMLYGDSAIFGVHVDQDKVVRQESRMQTVEHWQELPRLELIDPFGQWYRRATLSSGNDI